MPESGKSPSEKRDLPGVSLPATTGYSDDSRRDPKQADILVNMSDLQETPGTYRVSARGQFSLPASARRRWGIEGGGDVEVFDLGEAVVIFPGGPGTARRELAKALDADRYEQLLDQIDDPDLRDE